jgi:hypothetical protein
MFLKRIIDDSGVTLKTCGIIYDRHIFIVHAIGLFFALFFLIEGLVASLIFFFNSNDFDWQKQNKEHSLQTGGAGMANGRSCIFVRAEFSTLS